MGSQPLRLLAYSETLRHLGWPFDGQSKKKKKNPRNTTHNLGLGLLIYLEQWVKDRPWAVSWARWAGETGRAEGGRQRARAREGEGESMIEGEGKGWLGKRGRERERSWERERVRDGEPEMGSDAACVVQCNSGERKQRGRAEHWVERRSRWAIESRQARLGIFLRGGPGSRPFILMAD